MRIWLEYEGDSSDFLIALAGGVKRGIYLDGREVGNEAVGYVTTCMEDQGYIPITRVVGALANKRQYGGLAILYKMTNLKSKADIKTIVIKPSDEKNALDKAIEQVLAFFKKNKVPSSL